MLMDDRDAEVLCQRRREVVDGRTVEDDRAAVGSRRARGDVHQRRLTGAVLPEKGVDLAWEHLERDVRERRDCVVVLGDAEHRQGGMLGGPALRGTRVDGGFVDHDERPVHKRCARRPRTAARIRVLEAYFTSLACVVAGSCAER